MRIDTKWIKTVGLALGLPSTILVLAIIIKELVEANLISKLIGIIVFLVVIGNTLFLMVWYAYKSKHKS